MSLINEALKKAQKQRTGDTPSLTAMPAIGGESAARIARRGQPAGFNALVTRIGLGVAAVAVAIAVTFLILRRPAAAPTRPTPATATVTAPVAAPKPAETAPVTTVAPTPAPASLVVAPPTQPVAPAQTVIAAPASTTVILAPAETPKPVEVAPVQVAVEPPKPAAPAAARKLEPRAINFINTIRVAGIRASANDSKVLMNDRVYRIGDTVEAEMGLKLAGITPSSLTFEDENGGRFTRNF